MLLCASRGRGLAHRQHPEAKHRQRRGLYPGNSSNLRAGSDRCVVELFAAKVLGHHPIDAENSLPPLAEVLNSYRESYAAPRKVFDPYFSDLFRDPLVSLSWWAAFGFLTYNKNCHASLRACAASVGKR